MTAFNIKSSAGLSHLFGRSELNAPKSQNLSIWGTKPRVKVAPVEAHLTHDAEDVDHVLLLQLPRADTRRDEAARPPDTGAVKQTSAR